MLFRDRDLSDAFGFVYHKASPDSAADDVIRRLRSIINDAPQEDMVIAIILDGENPWEHYHDGGERFLSLLYSAFTRHELNQGGGIVVNASTVSEAITAGLSAQHLPYLHSGSWIHSDYKIWIGHQEDNCGWDLLGQTRTRLTSLLPSLPADRVRAATDSFER